MSAIQEDSELFVRVYWTNDRLYDLVITVPGFRSRGPVFDPVATIFSEN
jgi:hypothetical protein